MTTARDYLKSLRQTTSTAMSRTRMIADAGGDNVKEQCDKLLKLLQDIDTEAREAFQSIGKASAEL